MSYVRWGNDNSDVYLYEGDGGCVCCGCPLEPDEGLGYTTRDLDAMLGHLQLHRAAHHTVPAWVDTVLRERWPA